MLKHCVGKGRHVMKPLHVCLIVLQYYAIVATGRAGYVLYRALIINYDQDPLVPTCTETASYAHDDINFDEVVSNLSMYSLHTLLDGEMYVTL